MKLITLRFPALAALVLALVLGAGGSAIARLGDDEKGKLRPIGRPLGRRAERDRRGGPRARASRARARAGAEARTDAQAAPAEAHSPSREPQPKPTPRPQGPSRAELRRRAAAERRAALRRQRAEERRRRAAELRAQRGRAAGAEGRRGGRRRPAAVARRPSTTVPNFVIQRFRIPIFLLPIYQAAGIEYGVRWEVLAAINEIETDYGRNLNVSSAGAQGWMQFMPATWETYGTDANRDGDRDPYNPVDAIFAAAKYLKAAGAETDLRRAIFAYNHADWYVADVLERAEAIAAMPTAMVGALTGLADGRFPVRGPSDLRGRARPRLRARAGAQRREPRARRERQRGARLHGHRGRAAREGDQRQRRQGPARRSRASAAAASASSSRTPTATATATTASAG